MADKEIRQIEIQVDTKGIEDAERKLKSLDQKGRKANRSLGTKFKGNSSGKGIVTPEIYNKVSKRFKRLNSDADEIFGVSKFKSGVKAKSQDMSKYMGKITAIRQKSPIFSDPRFRTSKDKPGYDMSRYLGEMEKIKNPSFMANGSVIKITGTHKMINMGSQYAKELENNKKTIFDHPMFSKPTKKKMDDMGTRYAEKMEAHKLKKLREIQAEEKKIESERIKAEKERLRNIAKENAKAEKEKAKAEKENAKAEKERLKNIQKENAKAEKEKLKKIETFKRILAKSEEDERNKIFENPFFSKPSKKRIDMLRDNYKHLEKRARGILGSSKAGGFSFSPFNVSGGGGGIGGNGGSGGGGGFNNFKAIGFNGKVPEMKVPMFNDTPLDFGKLKKHLFGFTDGLASAGNSLTQFIGLITMVGGAFMMLSFAVRGILAKMQQLGDSFAGVEKDLLVGQSFRNSLTDSVKKAFDSAVERDSMYSGRTTGQSSAFVARASNQIREYNGSVNKNTLDNLINSVYGISAITGDDSEKTMNKILNVAKEGKKTNSLGIKSISLSRNMDKNLSIIAKAVMDNPIARSVINRGGTIEASMNSIKNAPKKLGEKLMEYWGDDISKIFSDVKNTLNEVITDPEVVYEFGRVMGNVKRFKEEVLTKENMKNTLLGISEWTAELVELGSKVTKVGIWVATHSETVLSVLNFLGKTFALITGLKIGKALIGSCMDLYGAVAWIGKTIKLATGIGVGGGVAGTTAGAGLGVGTTTAIGTTVGLGAGSFFKDLFSLRGAGAIAGGTLKLGLLSAFINSQETNTGEEEFLDAYLKNKSIRENSGERNATRDEFLRDNFSNKNLTNFDYGQFGGQQTVIVCTSPVNIAQDIPMQQQTIINGTGGM